MLEKSGTVSSEEIEEIASSYADREIKERERTIDKNLQRGILAKADFFEWFLDDNSLEKMGYDGEKLDRIYYTALLHDCGKIAIPDKILGKPGKLTDEEQKEYLKSLKIKKEK